MIKVIKALIISVLLISSVSSQPSQSADVIEIPPHMHAPVKPFSWLIPEEPDKIHTAPNVEREYLILLSTIFDTIKHLHVEEVDDKEVLEAAIRGMISKLDKHSSYMNPEEWKDMMENINDESFSGIGAQVGGDDKTGYVRVIAPIDGSPALKAGVKAGDLIMMVGDDSLKGLPLREAVNKIAGPKGSTAILKILRGEETLIINVIRDDIERQTVRLKLFDNNIGYVRLGTFTTHAVEKVEGALKQLLSESKDGALTGLVFDLRSNPGGLLTAAIAISDMFINTGEIVSTRGRFNKDRSSYSATSNLVIPLDTPVVVLIDGGSASASEIVSGTLQDLKRATIIGVKSYGKGSVQTVRPLQNGGGLRLTIAKYYTASGKVIHGVGITPDVIVELPTGYKRTSIDEIDPQLQKAFDVILSGEVKTGR